MEKGSFTSNQNILGALLKKENMAAGQTRDTLQNIWECHKKQTVSHSSWGN